MARYGGTCVCVCVSGLCWVRLCFVYDYAFENVCETAGLRMAAREIGKLYAMLLCVGLHRIYIHANSVVVTPN